MTQNVGRDGVVRLNSGLLLLTAALIGACKLGVSELEVLCDSCSELPEDVVGGVVQDLGHEPVPTVGAVVEEWGCDNPGTTVDGRGDFTIDLHRAECPTITVELDGFVPGVVGIGPEDLPTGIEVPLYDRAGEIEFSIEDFGVPYDPAYGAVLFHFYTGADTAASELTAGIRASIELEYGTVWALDVTDEHVAGDVVPEGSSSAEIWFHTVTPGFTALTIETPPGTRCTGPEELPVYADTYSHANYYCVED